MVQDLLDENDPCTSCATALELTDLRGLHCPTSKHDIHNYAYQRYDCDNPNQFPVNFHPLSLPYRAEDGK